MSNRKENILNVWKNKSKILEGIKNSLFTDDVVENIAEERINLCNSCEHIDHEGKSCVMPNTAPCCNLCGCCLHLATRSLSYTCKAGVWPTLVHSEEEAMELNILRKYLGHLIDLKDSGTINLDQYNDYRKDLIEGTDIQKMEVRFIIRSKLNL